MEYKGKYKEMAEQFKKDGADDYTIEKFIRQEMEFDEFHKGDGTTDIEALKEWQSIPVNIRDMFLHNAFCMNCGVATFKKGYNIRKNKFGIVIQGVCDKCGEPIARVCD